LFVGLPLIDFALYFASCLLTALITLEITGRFGNRLGASSSIWSAVLFAVFPGQAFFCVPLLRTSRIISFVVLFAVFYWLRSRKSIIWGLLLFILACSLEAYFYLHDQGRDASLRSDIASQLFFLTQTLAINNINLWLLQAAYSVVGLVVLSRLILNTLSVKALEIIVLSLLIAIALGYFPILNYNLWWQNIDFDWVYMVLAATAVAIGTSLACLPVLDSVRLNFSKAITLFGLIALIMLSMTFENLFTSYEKEICEEIQIESSL